MRHAVLALVIVLAIGACGDDDGPAPTPIGFSGVPLTFNDSATTLFVEIADTAEERATGLMNRESMPEDAGMLFVFPDDTEASFWMKDTLIPLSIAFVRADGTIIEIEDMEPQTEDSHASPEPFRYAIEVNQGWFDEYGITAGDAVDLSAATDETAPAN